MGCFGGSSESFVVCRGWPRGKFAVIILLSDLVDNKFSSVFPLSGMHSPGHPGAVGAGYPQPAQTTQAKVTAFPASRTHKYF